MSPVSSNRCSFRYAIIPPLGGFDLSFIVVIVLIGFVKNAIPGGGNFAYCSYL
jgi:uncharacterized protein YggT (Ycf19 family)